MLYCESCRCLSPSGTARCQNCRRGKLRPVGEEDFVLLQRADEYAAGKIGEALEAAGIFWESGELPAGKRYSPYDSEILPTDRELFVPYAQLQLAEEVSAAAGEALRRERYGEESEEEFEDMPPRKRLVVQILSVLAFLLLVCACVFAADALSGWLKGLLGF